jgi:predicted neuraminidase
MMDGVISSEFLYESAPFPSCHASTIVQARRGLLCAFFGGTHERHPDVCIWMCRRVDGRWSAPVNVADGREPDGSRQPTWNPVLFQPRGGPVMLFYKVGPSPSRWWGMVRTSEDDGITWSDPVRLPDGILGPIKNKPVQLEDGTIVSPTSIEGGSPHPNPPPAYRGRGVETGPIITSTSTLGGSPHPGSPPAYRGS